MNKMTRIPRDEYYMNIAIDVAKRSTCLRRQIGAVVVNGDVIVSTGYNGNPRGMPHCEDIGCIRDELEIPSGERMEICTGVHAEMNALLFAGKDANGGTLYATIVPCSTCAKMIINAGIRRVVYYEGYPDTMGFELLQQAGVPIDRVDMKVELVPPARPMAQVATSGVHKSMEEMREALYEKMRRMSALSQGKSINEMAGKLIKERMEALRSSKNKNDEG